MRITVARHAETNYNQQRLVNYKPDADVRLTDVGEAQAQELAEELKDEPIELIIVSELNRTRETAEVVNKYHDAPIVVDARLNDLRNGFEGRSIDEYHEWRDNVADPINARYGDGESIFDAANRTREFLDELPRHLEQNILIITSNHNMKHFKVMADGLTIDKVLELSMPNAAHFTFELDGVGSV